MGLGVCAFTCAVKCATQSGVRFRFRKTGVDDYLVNRKLIEKPWESGTRCMLVRIICTEECVCVCVCVCTVYVTNPRYPSLQPTLPAPPHTGFWVIGGRDHKLSHLASNCES